MTLASHLALRPCEPRDRAQSIRLLNHTFIYHNPLVVASNKPASQFYDFTSYLFDHCQPQGLSYVIEDTRKLNNQSNNQTLDDLESDSVLDHDRHLAAISTQPIVGVVMCLDKFDDADMNVLTESYSWAPEEGVVWDNLNKHPVKNEPVDQFVDQFEKHFDSRGQGLHVFLLSVNCACSGQHIARSLLETVYQKAQRLSYSYMMTDATHLATTHMFTRSPFNGRITHRLKAKDTVYTNKQGETIRLYENSDAEICSITCRIDRKWKLTINPSTVTVLKFDQSVNQSIMQSIIQSVDSSSNPNAFFTLTIAGGERSLIIDEPSLQSINQSIDQSIKSNPAMRYRVLSVVGPLASDLIGVLHQLLSLLKQQQISVLTVSTHDTDHILVPVSDHDKAINVLKEHGHELV